CAEPMTLPENYFSERPYHPPPPC
nr:Chain A, Cyclic extended Pep.1 [synthetic construct]